MAFELPKLPYKLNALVPHISEETLEFHYGKHHLAYVNNLNGLVPGTQFEKASLDAIIKMPMGQFLIMPPRYGTTLFILNLFPKQGREYQMESWLKQLINHSNRLMPLKSNLPKLHPLCSAQAGHGLQKAKMVHSR